MSEQAQIPAAVLELVRERIHSIEALEVLLLLRERGPEGAPLADLPRELRITDGLAQAAVDALIERRLATRSGDRVAYTPETEILASAVDQLGETYRTLRVETIVLISQNAISRVRKSALKTFSEAFRLRGPKKDG